MSSSAGDVGTLVMVSFRPSVEPMPMDASDRIDTASARERSGDPSWSWLAAVELTPDATNDDGDPGTLSERRLGDSARDAMAVGVSG